MMDEFGKRLTALEAKHQQEMAKLKVFFFSETFIRRKTNKIRKLIQAIIERNQQQQRPNAKMRDRVVVNMLEYPGTSQHRFVENRKQAIMAAASALVPPPPKSAALNLGPCHSAVRTALQTAYELREGIPPQKNMNSKIL
jgi:hypothetical protein